MRTIRAIALSAGLIACAPALYAAEDATGDAFPTFLSASPLRSAAPQMTPLEPAQSAIRADKAIKGSTTLSLEGEGTEASPYLIGTAADWNTLATYMATDSADMAGSYIKLSADIDFTGVTATPLYEFAGDFNGDSKSITGLDATADASYHGGLFTLATAASSIHDFSVYGQYSALSYSGAVVGTTYGTVANVASYVAVDDSAAESTTYCISGIVGVAASTATVSGCTYGDTITASGSYASGIVGYSYYCTISDCLNSGCMTAAGNYPAGITAYAYGATIKNCTNKASVTCYGEGGGGITGYAAYSTISGCSNEGTFYGTGYLLGNIAGGVVATTISGCSNSGTMTQTNTTYGYSGGIVGQMDTLSVATDCVNTGKLTFAGPYCGGVVGFAHYSTISGGSNQGAITTSSSQACGGVLGYAQYSTLSTLTNTASLTSTTYYFGGVAGYIYSCEVSEAVNKGSIVKSSKICTGGLFGGVAGSSAVADSYNQGAVKSSTTYAAGVVGLVGAGCSFTGCHNSGAVTYSGSTAQCYVAGFGSQAYASTFTNCYNSGKMTLSATAQYVGGLIGYLYTTSSTEIHTLTGCYNTADITASSYVAGLIGYVYTSVRVNMTGCYNTGTIYANSSAYAYAAGLSVYFCKNSTYTNCYNTGLVRSVAGKYTGGLFATNRTTSSSTQRTYMHKCYNKGKVTAAGSYAAGIAAYLNSFVTLDSCYNTSKITADSYAGGIAGMVAGSANSAIRNSYNTGDISATTGYAGGIAGYDNYRDTIENCFNTGDITATTSHAGGITGLGGSNHTCCYNTGDITGGTCVGGITGASKVGAFTRVVDCYTTGNVAATDSAALCGNVIGVDIVGDTTYWDSSNEIAGTYYLAANATEGAAADTTSLPLTYAELAALDMGENWISGDSCTYPRLATLADNDYAKAHAAAVIPADGDTYDLITGEFYLGLPDGVSWKASVSSVTIEGNTASFTESYSGELTMTATSGSVSATTVLNCDAAVMGINAAAADSREIVDEKLYTAAGTRVAQPADGHKAIYIVVRTYSDGTTEAVKEVR